VPIRPLPEDPSLENLKKRAKALVRAVRAGETDALALVREHHPRPEAALAKPALADAQLVLARSHGLASWARLRTHLGVVERHRWDPPPPLDRAALEAADPADAFLRLACLAYGSWHPTWLPRAERLLAERPELPRTSVHAAAAAGDVDALRAWLDEDPGLLEAKGGPLRWEPLLYACYSRLAPADGRSTLDAARLLLARGADPDAGFLWRGNVPPFTALTGAFGEGEDGNNQPPHPERDALARALLEAGADPNDEQTLYNRHFRSDDGHLVLLFEHGLGRERDGRWRRLFGDRLFGPRQMLAEELWAAAKRGFPERARLLLDHGVDPNLPGRRDGRTPYEAALASGQRGIAELLAARGARRVEPTPEQAFAAACVAGDREEVDALLARDPGLLERLDPDARAELVSRAVDGRRHAGIRLMAELGFDLSRLRRNTPLHGAAWAGDVETIELLLELGADPRVRDPEFGATPLGWAAHNHQRAAVERLLPLADLADAIELDGVERAAELLRADPALARGVDPAGRPWVFALHPGLRRADELLALLAAHGADLAARDAGGRTAAERADERGGSELAERLRRWGG